MTSKKVSLYYFFLVICLISSLNLKAQNLYRCRYTGFGVNINTSYFQGDVNTHFSLLRPGVGLHINRQYSPRIHLMLELNWICLIGDDHLATHRNKEISPFEYTRNLHFRNDIKELGLNIQYDLLPSTDYRKRPVYNIYATTGLIGFYHNPRAKNKDGKWVDLKPLRTENKNYSGFNFAIPIGAGFRYKINSQWDLEAEISYKITSTDYLDDVSGNYELPSDLAGEMSNRSGDLVSMFSGKERDLQFLQQLGNRIIETENYNYVSSHGPGSTRGSRWGWDNYVLLNFRIRYNIPGMVNCPKFREDF